MRNNSKEYQIKAHLTAFISNYLMQISHLTKYSKKTLSNDADNNQLVDIDIEHLAVSSQHQKFILLKLSNNRLTYQCGRSLGSIIVHQQICVLKLRSNCISDAGLTILTKYLINDTNLEDFDMSNNHLSAQSDYSIGSLLSHTKSLHSLDTSNNSISCIQQISQSLTMNKSLRTLDLSKYVSYKATK